MYLLGHNLGGGGCCLCPGALCVSIFQLYFMSVLDFQSKLEQKMRTVVKKYDDQLFFLFRMIVYICFCSTIKVQTTTDPTQQLINYIEIVNYLLILAIIILFPSLDDIRQL